MKISISQEVKEKYPDLEEVILPVYDVKIAKNDNFLTKADYEKTISRLGRDKILEHNYLLNFRKFCRNLGIDTEKYTPSVENLLRRYLKEEYIPHVNNIVDLTNKVAVESFVATGVFDLDQITGDLELRFTRPGEEFKPLGGGLEALPEGLVVIADQEKILNLFPYRDSIYPKISYKTKNVLILADCVGGMEIDTVKKAVERIGNLFKSHAGGSVGELSLTEEKSTPGLVDKPKLAESINSKIQVYSGTRATGRLHLGNYLGAVKGYIELQQKYSCVYSVVDLHAITTPYDKDQLSQNTLNVVMDYLSAGLNPEKSFIEVQSLVPQHMELAYYLGTLYPVARLEDLPTYKEKKAQFPKYINIGLLYYPVLMAADILLYKASLVPVGVDQEPHLEVTREIARNFNRVYGETFSEPHRFATPGQYIPSLIDKGKMSKTKEGSYINLVDDLQTIRDRLAHVPTDSGTGKLIKERTENSLPNFDEINSYNAKQTPESFGVATLFKLVEFFQGLQKRMEYQNQYKSVGIRYKDLKEQLALAIFKELQPIQERRKKLEENPGQVKEMLFEHAKKLRKLAQETVDEVKEKMGFLK